MSRSLTNLSVLASFSVAWPAALVSVPTTPQPSFPVAGLEANRGQANAGILFLSAAWGSSIAVAAQSVLFSPLGASLNLVASNPNPTVSFSDPLPGLVNSYTGADSHKWITGIPRYTTATVTAIYPGISAQYMVDSSGVLNLNLLLAPGVNLNAVQFSIPAHAQLIQMGMGFWVSRILYAAAKLKLADLLAEEPKSAAELARQTNSHPPSLYRLLRTLAGLGVVTENASHHFVLTPLGEALKTGAPGSARATILALAGDMWYQGWQHILY